jgi:EAL domain-containing protein (putative c-di-GMP-specific phosphodiesterase class I)
MVNNVLNVVKKPFKINKTEISLTVSMGISIYPKDGASVDDLLQKAHGAMYRVKKAGGNGFKFCDADESNKTFKLFSLENDLRNAIENDEFELCYQPLIDLQSRMITGVEALIRWNHPTQGLLMPIDFLQIAEESGLIVPMGEWVLRKACAQNKLWQKANLPPFKVAVNVSSTQLVMPKFSKLISYILKETKLDPTYLEIELTETILADNVELMLQVLNEIKKLGVGLVMDDFGTGYSSLNYIKQFPFDKIKIDRSFLQNICSNEDDYSLLQSMLVMAENLKLKIVVEGVETEEQLSLLKDGKGGQLQGYLFSKPLDAKSLPDFIRHYSVQRSK